VGKTSIVKTDSDEADKEEERDEVYPPLREPADILKIGQNRHRFVGNIKPS
jgi:hypothetical protein